MTRLNPVGQLYLATRLMESPRVLTIWSTATLQPSKVCSPLEANLSRVLSYYYHYHYYYYYYYWYYYYHYREPQTERIKLARLGRVIKLIRLAPTRKHQCNQRIGNSGLAIWHLWWAFEASFGFFLVFSFRGVVSKTLGPSWVDLLDLLTFGSTDSMGHFQQLQNELASELINSFSQFEFCLTFRCQVGSRKLLSEPANDLLGWCLLSSSSSSSLSLLRISLVFWFLPNCFQS